MLEQALESLETDRGGEPDLVTKAAGHADAGFTELCEHPVTLGGHLVAPEGTGFSVGENIGIGQLEGSVARRKRDDDGAVRCTCLQRLEDSFGVDQALVTKEMAAGKMR